MRYPSIDLSGATVAITGGARGIGAATAALFAARGARVSIGDLDLELAERTASELGGTAYHLDVADKDSYAAFLGAVGPVDVLVNNAGVMPNGPFLEEDDRATRLMLEVNVYGVINGMRLALPGMVARGRGHVVNVASLAGKFPVPGLAVYNASKYAVVGLTAATRLEMAPYGVSVSAILPSAVDTGLASGLSMKPIPKVQPEAIAAAVVASVRSRRAETPVPEYVGGLAMLAAVTPEPVMRRVRRLIRDDRAMQSDAADRVAYRQRLNDQR